MDKINTHKLLSEYHDRPNYPEIAKFTAEFAKTLNIEGDYAKEAILNKVKLEFGKMTLPEYNIRPRVYGITVFGELGGLVPWNAYNQMIDCMGIPPALRASLMPDAHKGYGLPIGGVIELDNAISPGYVGFDISCMVSLSMFDVAVKDFMRERSQFAKDLRDSTIFGVGKDFSTLNSHPVMDDDRWNITNRAKNMKALAHKQLGTSGGGNHFADLVIINNLAINKEPMVGLLTHSGSRGTGYKFATYYSKLAEKITKATTRKMPKGHGYLLMDSDPGREYLQVMELMGEYAHACHSTIHRTFAKKVGFKIIDNIWNRHNYVWKLKNNVYVHRKGATPAKKDQIGLIPGTSGSLSYVVKGLGNPLSLFSSSHGAGRPYSRTEAKTHYVEEEFKQHMDKSDIIHIGVAPDETIKAYKDIEDVMKKQDDILITRIASLEPKVVIMGGKADDGD